MFILVTLKRSLYHLDVSANPRIDDAAVPALVLLSRLSVLLFLGTNIGMNGLRLFASTMSRERRHIRLEIPPECERYLDSEDFPIFLIYIEKMHIHSMSLYFSYASAIFGPTTPSSHYRTGRVLSPLHGSSGTQPVPARSVQSRHRDYGHEGGDGRATPGDFGEQEDGPFGK
jgi:hypothetical protein